MSKLYIIPTPIGNLEDITLRALRMLKEVDLILAEDTRTAGFLLKHYSIETSLSPFHKFNEHKSLNGYIQRIKSGIVTGLVSDAGTPGISDPGFLLIRECIREGIEVECLPGATALIPGLISSGYPTERFTFEGFLPHKKGRQSLWKSLIGRTETTVLFESPHRLLKALQEATEYLEPGRELSVSRELSKKFEETIRGNAQELLRYFEKKGVKGEIVIVIRGV
jgi:16S rRNA (cytidine1402-2'-O)-methyltransferase